MKALLHTKVVQLRRKVWHDKYIKTKAFQKDDWAILYGSRFKDFKGKLMTGWLRPYLVEEYYDNNSVKKTINEEQIPLLVNGYWTKIYKKPLSMADFTHSISK